MRAQSLFPTVAQPVIAVRSISVEKSSGTELKPGVCLRHQHLALLSSGKTRLSVRVKTKVRLKAPIYSRHSFDDFHVKEGVVSKPHPLITSSPMVV